MVTNTASRDIIVIGTSAGGLPLLRKIVRGLPVDFPAAVFVVLHTAPNGPGYLAGILDADSLLPAHFPKDGERIEPGKIYVAPVDHHMMVDPGRIVVVRGPRENRFRPAIDPLFRSAAVHYGARVIGVILSGLLDDGAAGLLAVKSCGGVTVVQDPAEADFPDMIQAAIRATPPDHCAGVAAMPALFADLVQETVDMAEDKTDPALRLRVEADMAAMRRSGAEEVGSLGRLSRLVCPECNGALWEIDDNRLLRYRCHVGHAYTAESLAADQSEALERALAVALRTLEDTAALSGRLAAEAEQKQRVQSATIFRRRAEEAHHNANELREIIVHQKALRAQPGEAGADGNSRVED